MPRLAIVIRAVGDIQSLEDTLVSVLEHRPQDCEVLVALAQPYADPYNLQGEVRLVKSSASPQAALQVALSLARAPFVHLLASGCKVTEGWTDAVLQRFGDRRVAAVSPLVVDALDHDRLASIGIGYWPCGKHYLVGSGQPAADALDLGAPLGPSAAAGFYRRAALDLVGGLCPRLGRPQAEVDLALALQAAGFTSVVETQSCVFGAPTADEAPSPFWRAFADERLFRRNLTERSRGKALRAHATRVLGEMLRAFGRPRMVTQLAGRLWARVYAVSDARHRRDLAALAERATTAKPAAEHVRIDRGHAPHTQRQATQARTSAH